MNLLEISHSLIAPTGTGRTFTKCKHFLADSNVFVFVCFVCLFVCLFNYGLNQKLGNCWAVVCNGHPPWNTFIINRPLLPTQNATYILWCIILIHTNMLIGFLGSGQGKGLYEEKQIFHWNLYYFLRKFIISRHSDFEDMKNMNHGLHTLSEIYPANCICTINVPGPSWLSHSE